MNVSKYIEENWKNTVRDPKTMEDDGWLIKLRKPFSVPSASEGFNTLYYWDTYFINVGLLSDGLYEQAENNLDNFLSLLCTFGYIPNSARIVASTQPPLFTRAVYDLYEYKKDIKVIEKFLFGCIKELNFWQTDRTTSCGLAGYKHSATNARVLECYEYYVGRVGIKPSEKHDKLKMSENLYALAESGWDMTPRCETVGNDFAGAEFAYVDLNAILYDAELKVAKMLKITGDEPRAIEYAKKAAYRKKLMYEYMLDKETGIFYDYCFTNKHLSRVLSAASFTVYAFGISDDKSAIKKVLEKLELPYGLSACEKRDKKTNVVLQWDYPSMWPSNVYFAVEGLKAVGLIDDAKRIAEKYCKTVETVFEKTGMLWEKYDASKAEVAFTTEYETVPMMGWTAGMYKYFKKKCF